MYILIGWWWMSHWTQAWLGLPPAPQRESLFVCRRPGGRLGAAVTFCTPPLRWWCCRVLIPRRVPASPPPRPASRTAPVLLSLLLSSPSDQCFWYVLIQFSCFDNPPPPRLSLPTPPSPHVFHRVCVCVGVAGGVTWPCSATCAACVSAAGTRWAPAGSLGTASATSPRAPAPLLENGHTTHHTHTHHTQSSRKERHIYTHIHALIDKCGHGSTLTLDNVYSLRCLALNCRQHSHVWLFSFTFNFSFTLLYCAF